jgi:hypothetical protein
MILKYPGNETEIALPWGITRIERDIGWQKMKGFPNGFLAFHVRH